MKNKNEGVKILASEFDLMLKRMANNYSLSLAETVGTVVIQLVKVILNINDQVEAKPRTEEEDDNFGTTD